MVKYTNFCLLVCQQSLTLPFSLRNGSYFMGALTLPYKPLLRKRLQRLLFWKPQAKLLILSRLMDLASNPPMLAQSRTQGRK
jgi:hypothetical protein